MLQLDKNKSVPLWSTTIFHANSAKKIFYLNYILYWFELWQPFNVLERIITEYQYHTCETDC